MKQNQIFKIMNNLNLMPLDEVILKDVDTIKKEVNVIQVVANNIEIRDEESFKNSSDVLAKIKQYGKVIKDRREAITRPLLTSLNSVRDLFRGVEDACESAEKTIKNKVSSYIAEQEIKINIEKQKIADQIEKGKLKNPETIAKKLDNIDDVKKDTEGEFSKIRTREVKKIKIVDETLLPREYLIPNEKKITEDFKNGIEIPGTEIYIDRIIESR